MIGATRVVVSRTELVGLVVAAGAAILAVLVVLGADKPLVLLAAPIGGVGLVLAARRPLLALIIMVAIEASNLSGVLAPRGVPVFPASMLLGVLTVGFALRDPQVRSRINPWTWICAGFLAVYLATQLIATIDSVDVATSIAGLRRPVLDCVFVMVVLVLVQISARPWAVAGAIVIPFAVLSVLTVIDEVFFHGTQSFGGFSTVTEASGELITTLRYGGPTPDSNFWGRHLIMGLPFAAALLTRARRSGSRWATIGWTLAIVAQLAGIYLTQSRGTFLAAGIAIAVWFIASNRSVRRWGLMLVPLALLTFVIPGVGNRLVAALTDVQAQSVVSVDPSLLARIAAQQEAWMMFQERPFFGFGPATFPGQVVEFAGRLPIIAVREPAPAPHSIYAEFAAESGILGLLGWALVILGFLTVVVLGIVQQPESRDRVLAAAVCAAIIAWSASSIALHLTYFRTLGVVLALAAGLAPSWPVATLTVRKLLRYMAVWLTAALLGFFAFWLYQSATTSPAVTASQRMTLVPVGPTDGWYGYALDVRSRIELLPTFAVMMHDPDSPVDINADPVRGLLTFTTTTTDNADAARDELQLAVAYADNALHASIGYQQYSLQTVDSMRIVPSETRSPSATLIASALGAGTAVVAGLALSRVADRRRGADPVDHPSAQELASV